MPQTPHSDTTKHSTMAIAFFPYLALYFGGTALGASVQTVRSTFLSLHILWFGLLLKQAWKDRALWKSPTFLFFFCLFFIFLSCGAYLEYPTDPIEHFRRIFAWNNVHQIRENPFWTRFSYFFNWTLIGHLNPEHRRAGASLVGALTQTLLSLQFYFLCQALRIDSRWAKIHTIVFLALFGTGPFSFRYYALAPSILGQVALWALCARLFVSIQSRHWRPLVLQSPLLIALMAGNHPQTLLLLTVILFSCALYFCFNQSSKTRVSMAVVGIVGVIIGWGLIRLGQKTLYDLYDYSVIGAWGGVKFWVPEFRFINTLGIHGLLAILLALFLFQQKRMFDYLTFGPILFLLWPPTAFFTSRFVQSHPSVMYRILFAFPTSVALLEGLRFVLNRTKLSPRIQRTVAIGICLLLSINPKSPWDGRLLFQFYTPPTELNYRELDFLAAELIASGKIELVRTSPHCHLWTDNITQVMLDTHFSLFPGGERLSPLNAARKSFPTTASIPRDLIENGYCFVLLRDPASLTHVPWSRAGRISRHWPEDVADQKRWLNKDFSQWVKILTDAGWNAIPLHNNYIWIESPSLSSRLAKSSGIG